MTSIAVSSGWLHDSSACSSQNAAGSLVCAFPLSSKISVCWDFCLERRRSRIKCSSQQHSGSARLGFFERCSFGERIRTRRFCKNACRIRTAAASVDYYDILGVDRSASKQDIKHSYRKLAREFHPDVNKAPNAADKFKQIAAAYEVLGDDQKRSVYDTCGEDGFNESYMGHPYDFYESFFGRSASGFTSIQGNDVSYDLVIDLEEAVFGASKKIDIMHMEKCEKCAGTGAKSKTRKKCRACRGMGEMMRSERTPLGFISQIVTCMDCGGSGEMCLDPCRNCAGTGRARTRKTIKLDIPCGVDSGSTLRVAGGGDAGEKGGPPGDLFVNLRIKEIPGIRRDGTHLYSDVLVSYTGCILGTSKKVMTVDGYSELEIPPGTQAGDTLVLQKHGVPRLRRPSTRGDHLFIVKVVLPTRISEAEKVLVEELDRLQNHDDEQQQQQQQQQRAQSKTKKSTRNRTV